MKRIAGVGIVLAGMVYAWRGTLAAPSDIDTLLRSAVEQKRVPLVVAMVADRIAREMRGNGAHGMNARLAAEMLFGMIRSVCLYRDESDRLGDIARLVKEVFLHGVAPRRGAGSAIGFSRPKRVATTTKR